MSLDNEEAAASCLEKATAAYENGDEKRALHFAEKAVRMSGKNPRAQQLIEQIKQWGSESENAAHVKKALEADYYTVLDIAREDQISEGTLRKAYLRQSKSVHPDKNRARGADDAFKRLGLAYDTLRDPMKKASYDQTLNDMGSSAAARARAAASAAREEAARYEEMARQAAAQRAAAQAPPSMTPEKEVRAALHSAKLSQLRAACKVLNIYTIGNKSALVDRLAVHFIQADCHSSANKISPVERCRELIREMVRVENAENALKAAVWSSNTSVLRSVLLEARKVGVSRILYDTIQARYEALDPDAAKETEWKPNETDTEALRRAFRQEQEKLEREKFEQEKQRQEKLRQEKERQEKQRQAEAEAAARLRQAQKVAMEEAARAQRKAMEEALRAQRKAEQERKAAEKAAAIDLKRREAERKAEERRLAAEKQREKERLASERRAQAARAATLAAEQRRAAAVAAELERIEAARQAAARAKILFFQILRDEDVLELFQRLDLATLHALRSTCHRLAVCVRTTIRSSSWRAVASNVHDLADQVPAKDVTRWLGQRLNQDLSAPSASLLCDEFSARLGFSLDSRFCWFEMLVASAWASIQRVRAGNADSSDEEVLEHVKVPKSRGRRKKVAPRATPTLEATQFFQDVDEDECEEVVGHGQSEEQSEVAQGHAHQSSAPRKRGVAHNDDQSVAAGKRGRKATAPAAHGKSELDRSLPPRQPVPGASRVLPARARMQPARFLAPESGASDEGEDELTVGTPTGTAGAAKASRYNASMAASAAPPSKRSVTKTAVGAKRPKIVRPISTDSSDDEAPPQHKAKQQQPAQSLGDEEGKKTDYGTAADERVLISEYMRVARLPLEEYMREAPALLVDREQKSLASPSKTARCPGKLQDSRAREEKTQQDGIMPKVKKPKVSKTKKSRASANMDDEILSGDEVVMHHAMSNIIGGAQAWAEHSIAGEEAPLALGRAPRKTSSCFARGGTTGANRTKQAEGRNQAQTKKQELHEEIEDLQGWRPPTWLECQSDSEDDEETACRKRSMKAQLKANRAAATAAKAAPSARTSQSDRHPSTANSPAARVGSFASPSSNEKGPSPKEKGIPTAHPLRDSQQGRSACGRSFPRVHLKLSTGSFTSLETADSGSSAPMIKCVATLKVACDASEVLDQLDDQELLDSIDALPQDIFEGMEVQQENQQCPRAPGQATIDDKDQDDEFDVEKILKMRPPSKPGSQAYFLIRWLGFGPEHDTWEPEDCIAADLVSSFRQQQEAKAARANEARIAERKQWFASQVPTAPLLEKQRTTEFFRNRLTPDEETIKKGAKRSRDVADVTTLPSKSARSNTGCAEGQENETEWDAAKVGKAVRALLRKQEEPGNMSIKEIRRRLEEKLGFELKQFKDVIKDASVQFVLSLKA